MLSQQARPFFTEVSQQVVLYSFLILARPSLPVNHSPQIYHHDMYPSEVHETAATHIFISEKLPINGLTNTTCRCNICWSHWKVPQHFDYQKFYHVLRAYDKEISNQRGGHYTDVQLSINSVIVFFFWKALPFILFLQLLSFNCLRDFPVSSTLILKV